MCASPAWIYARLAAATESFEFIFGPWNILSAFNPEERIQILRRVHNLLTPGGVFAFSAHNRDWKYAGGHPLSKPLRPRNVIDALHPMSWAKLSLTQDVAP